MMKTAFPAGVGGTSPLKNNLEIINWRHGNYLANSKKKAISYSTAFLGQDVMEFSTEIDMSQFTASKSFPLPPLGCMSWARGISGTPAKIKLFTGLGSLLLLSACAAPGMKLSVKSGSQATTTQMDGLNVTLRPLDPQVARARAARIEESSSINELLVEKAPPYKIGPQDILLVTVWDHPEITLPLGQFRTDAATGMVVDEEGILYFPYSGKIKVGGLTVSQAREALTTQLSKVLQRPQVDVKVISYRSQKVYVGGEVKNPAVYTVTDVPFTLAEAVNRAGGFLPTSDDSRSQRTDDNLDVRCP